MQCIFIGTSPTINDMGRVIGSCSFDKIPYTYEIRFQEHSVANLQLFYGQLALLISACFFPPIQWLLEVILLPELNRLKFFRLKLEALFLVAQPSCPRVGLQMLSMSTARKFSARIMIAVGFGFSLSKQRTDSVWPLHGSFCCPRSLLVRGGHNQRKTSTSKHSWLLHLLNQHMRRRLQIPVCRKEPSKAATKATDKQLVKAGSGRVTKGCKCTRLSCSNYM